MKDVIRNLQNSPTSAFLCLLSLHEQILLAALLNDGFPLFGRFSVSKWISQCKCSNGQCYLQWRSWRYVTLVFFLTFLELQFNTPLKQAGSMQCGYLSVSHPKIPLDSHQ